MKSPELTGRTALVTGGAGFIGSHVVDALVAAGLERVVVIDDLSLGDRNNLAAAVRTAGVELVVGDCADLALLGELASDPPFDFCFNMAVIPLPASLEHPRETVDHNVRMTTAVAELGRRGGYRKLVQFSSSEVYGTTVSAPMTEDHPLNPMTPYAASKLATDQIALSYMRTFDLPVVVVRPFNTYGPRQNDKAYAGLIPQVIGDVARGRPVTIHGDGAQTRDYAFVTDVARGAVALATAPEAAGRIVNLGSGAEVTVVQLVAHLLGALDNPDWPVVHDEERPGDVRRLIADVSVAEELVGYRSEVDLPEGLRRTIEWYRQAQPAATAD